MNDGKSYRVFKQPWYPDNRRSGGCSVFITALVFAALLGRQRNSIEKLQVISESLSHLQESFVRTNLNLETVANRLQNSRIAIW